MVLQRDSLVYVVLIALIAFFIIEVSFTYNDSILHIDRSKEDSIQTLQSKHFANILAAQKTSEALFQSYLDSEYIITLLSDIQLSDQAQVHSIQNELYDYVSNFFEKVENLGFNRLHFHTADSRCVLRFGSGEEAYEHIDTSYQRSIISSLQNGQVVYGLDDPLYYIGYRYIYPLFDQADQFIGSVEFGMPLDEMLRLFLLPDTQNHYLFLLRRSLVEDNLDEAYYREHFVSYPASEDYLSYAFQARSSSSIQLNDELIEKIDASASSNLVLTDERDAFFDIRLDGRLYTMTLIAVNSYTGRHIGYLGSYARDDNLATLIQHNTGRQLSIILQSSILLIGVSIVFYSRHKMKQMAIYDSLTGVFNRNRYYMIIDRETSFTNRYAIPLSVILLDLDRFKHVNDTYGHKEGDELLKTLGGLLITNLRKSDYLFRWGGEEFLLLLPSTTVTQATETAEKLRKLIALQFENLGITSSFGVTEYIKGEDPERAVYRADVALYQAKESGRNMVITNTYNEST